jgi:peptidoglycan/LPS O-acetylase OafA/YrhL
MRRSLRIFPLYFAALMALALYAVVRDKPEFLNDLPYHATYTSNWVPVKTMALTWSLSTEEQFYLLWPPLLVLLGYRSLWALVPFLAVNQLVNFGALDRWVPYDSLAILQCTFTPIVLGVLLAMLLDRKALRLPSWTILAGFVVMLAIALSPNDVRGWPRLLFHLTATATIAAVVLHPTHFIVRALEWRPLAFVGTISYGMYLLHTIVIDVLHRAMEWPTAPLFLWTMVLTTVAAGLSYRFFERPFLRLKERFR